MHAEMEQFHPIDAVSKSPRKKGLSNGDSNRNVQSFRFMVNQNKLGFDTENTVAISPAPAVSGTPGPNDMTSATPGTMRVNRTKMAGMTPHKLVEFGSETKSVGKAFNTPEQAGIFQYDYAYHSTTKKENVNIEEDFSSSQFSQSRGPSPSSRSSRKSPAPDLGMNTPTQLAGTPRNISHDSNVHSSAFRRMQTETDTPEQVSVSEENNGDASMQSTDSALLAPLTPNNNAANGNRPGSPSPASTQWAHAQVDTQKRSSTPAPAALPPPSAFVPLNPQAIYGMSPTSSSSSSAVINQSPVVDKAVVTKGAVSPQQHIKEDKLDMEVSVSAYTAGSSVTVAAPENANSCYQGNWNNWGVSLNRPGVRRGKHGNEGRKMNQPAQGLSYPSQVTQDLPVRAVDNSKVVSIENSKTQIKSQIHTSAGATKKYSEQPKNNLSLNDYHKFDPRNKGLEKQPSPILARKFRAQKDLSNTTDSSSDNEMGFTSRGGKLKSGNYENVKFEISPESSMDDAMLYGMKPKSSYQKISLKPTKKYGSKTKSSFDKGRDFSISKSVDAEERGLDELMTSLIRRAEEEASVDFYNPNPVLRRNMQFDTDTSSPMSPDPFSFSKDESLDFQQQREVSPVKNTAVTFSQTEDSFSGIINDAAAANEFAACTVEAEKSMINTTHASEADLSMMTSATTISVADDSYMNVSGASDTETKAPYLVLGPRKNNSNTSAMDDIKEITLSCPPGSFTTLVLSFSNKRERKMLLKPRAILVRFDNMDKQFGVESDIDSSDISMLGPSGSVFQVSPHVLSMHTGECANMYITFSPKFDAQGIYGGALKIKSKGKSFVLLLRGEAKRAITHVDRSLEYGETKKIGETNENSEEKVKVIEEMTDVQAPKEAPKEEKNTSKKENYKENLTPPKVSSSENVIRSNFSTPCASPLTDTKLSDELLTRTKWLKEWFRKENSSPDLKISSAENKLNSISISPDILKLETPTVSLISAVGMGRNCSKGSICVRNNLSEPLELKITTTNPAILLSVYGVTISGHSEFNVSVTFKDKATSSENNGLSNSMSHLGYITFSPSGDKDYITDVRLEDTADKTAELISSSRKAIKSTEYTCKTPSKGVSMLRSLSKTPGPADKLSFTCPLTPSVYQNKSDDTATLQRLGVFFKQNVADFGEVCLGTLSRYAIDLCNNTDTTTTIYLSDPDLPFVLLHNEIIIPGNSVISIPVRFVPISNKTYSSDLVAQTADGTSIMTCRLVGSSIAI